MTIKQFIQKAIEGGYHDYIEQPESVKVEYWGTRDAYPADECYKAYLSWGNDTDEEEYYVPNIFFDPKVWQAVGKGMDEWCDNDSTHSDGTCLTCSFPHCDSSWLDYQHHMIDALAEGKSIKDYIKTL